MVLIMTKLVQALVASMSIPVSLAPGNNYNDTYLINGTVHASDLRHYVHFRRAEAPILTPWNEVEQAIAHSYGEMALNSQCCDYTDISQVQSYQQVCRYFCKREPKNQQQFAYRFLEYNPDDAQRANPKPTKRVVTASSGPCFNYSARIVGGVVPDDDGDKAALRFEYSNETFKDSITIPKQSMGFDSTTYIYRGIKTPQNASEWSCGPRCMWMWAHRSLGVDTPEKEHFYQCPIMIDQVTNMTDPATQEISNDMARLAASAIGLSGRYTGKPENKVWKQYQYYPYG